LHVHGVHLGEVIHVRQEDIDLDDLGDVGAGLLEDVGQVLNALVLFSDEVSFETTFEAIDDDSRLNWGLSYSVGLDITINQLASGSVHGNSTGAVNDAIGNDSLGVDTGERLGGLVGEDGGLSGHCDR
jgi:hypothetical protein